MSANPNEHHYEVPIQVKRSGVENGQSETLPLPETPEYDFTAPTNTIPLLIERGDRKLVISYELKKPTSLQLYERQRGIVSETEEATQGEAVISYNEDTANAALFNLIVVGAEVREHGSEKVTRTLTRDECLRLPNERKSGVVKRLFRAKYETASEDDGDGVDFLFEDSADEIKVRQSIGDPLSPSFVVYHRLRRPTQSQRDSFKQKGTQLRAVRRGDKPRTRIVTDLRAAETLYNALFVGLEGAVGEAKDVDAVFKAGVIAEAIKSFEDEGEGF